MATCWNRISERALVLWLCLSAVPASALTPLPVAPDTWMVQGATEEFDPRNGGDISNSAFIVTPQGVVVIDTGSTLAYGRALRRAIAALTDQPVRWVINTHHHPDHVFGNAAFDDARIMALPGTIAALARDAPAFLATLTARLGETAQGTVTRLPETAVSEGTLDLDGYVLQLYALRGHTGADLVILDPRTGVLFAGDLLFWQRAPTTPHTPSLVQWLADLDELAALEVNAIVPGHGPLARSDAPLLQTRAWLVWLDALLREGVARGATQNELLHTRLPDALARLPLARFELTRSISHFYRRYEDQWWQDGDAPLRPNGEQK
ncbi:quinoprotein relay system zinc metallohydrolase 1 [Alcanivorax sp. S71-1-4]|uniref:quinoprotein relay system zinc metallohydrolase 1 n=1 Tax=Alcanivorax sp. S71-1-4 TaxID=1177159 RepID=UPI00135A25C9|nr:quinoprotein relay system zinc metallohydrolase 1 [Alcanivorax sp. S71-1-4]